MGSCCKTSNQDPYTVNSIFGTKKSLQGRSKSIFQKPKDKLVKQGTIALHIANMVRRKSIEIHKEYKFNEVLGKGILSFFIVGAYGEVRKAVHKITGITRAIKSITKDNMRVGEKAKLINEVEILKSLVFFYYDKGSSKHSESI